MKHEEILTKMFGMLTRGVADRKFPLHKLLSSANRLQSIVYQ